MSMEERIEQLEFQIELLFNNTELDRLMFEYKITRTQYQNIMDLMESLENKLSNGEEISAPIYEANVYEIVPQINRDYHFCELMALDFAKNGRWKDVFIELYGNELKFKSIVEEMR